MIKNMGKFVYIAPYHRRQSARPIQKTRSIQMESKRVRDYSALTPDPARYIAPPLTVSELETLKAENRKLQREVTYLRTRHETLENALARQLREAQRTAASLERTLTTVREAAVALFAKDLVPTGSKQ
jgi:molecular chaperone GrpE (heat shock protein)